MPYQVPFFNQTCTISTPAAGARPAFVESVVPVQVMGVVKLRDVDDLDFFAGAKKNTILKFPARTYVLGVDVDGAMSTVTMDDDTNTVYHVRSVWDVGQGFANEYRACLAQRITALPGQEAPPLGD